MRIRFFILTLTGLIFAGVFQNSLAAQTNAPVSPGGNPATVNPANPGTVNSTTNRPATFPTVNPGTSKPSASNPGVPGAASSNPNNPGTIPVAPVPDTPKKPTDPRKHSGSNPGLNPGTTQQRTNPKPNPGTTAPRTYPKINPGTTGGPGGPRN